MNFFFLIDEYTDVEPAHVVREQVDIIIDALHNPHKPRPEGEVVLGESARQFVIFRTSYPQRLISPLVSGFGSWRSRPPHHRPRSTSSIASRII